MTRRASQKKPIIQSACIVQNAMQQSWEAEAVMSNVQNIECLVAQGAKSITCTSLPGQNSRLKHNQGEKRFAFRELGLQHNPSRATPTRESTAHAEHEPRVHTLYLFSWIVEGLNVSLKLKHVSICTRAQIKPQKQPPVAWKVLNTRMRIQTIIDEM